MNDPATDKGLEIKDGELVDKKEYVKPNIEEGVEVPTATAVIFTPANFG